MLRFIKLLILNLIFCIVENSIQRGKRSIKINPFFKGVKKIDKIKLSNQESVNQILSPKVSRRSKLKTRMFKRNKSHKTINIGKLGENKNLLNQENNKVNDLLVVLDSPSCSGV
jgi:hypothetical protein